MLSYAFVPFLALLSPPAPQEPAAEAPALMAAHEEAERWAAETLKGLSLERKAAQLVCIPVRGEYAAEDDPALQAALRLVREVGVGALVLYGGTPREAAFLLDRLQRESALPLLVTSDFEGGPGQQFAGAAEFPPNLALAAAGSEELARRVGRACSREGRAIGVHVTWSPAVDVLTRPENPVASVRTFGGDLELGGRLLRAYIWGCQEQGLFAGAKHFPGRGDVELIPGTKFAILRKQAGPAEAENLRPFRDAAEAGVAFVMTEHIAVPALAEGSELPASVEGKLVAGWLRARLGFRGVISTDDLWYPHVTARFGAEGVALRALEAGHDLLLKPADPAATVAAVVEAVRAAKLAEARIDESVKRILYCKARLNLHRNRVVDPARIAGAVGIQPHRELVREVADRSLTLLVDRGFFPERAGKPGRLVHVTIQKRENDEAPPAVAARLAAAFPGTRWFQLRPDSAPEAREAALAAAKEGGTVVVSLFHQRTAYKDNGPLRPEDLGLVREMIRARPEAVVIMSYGNPYLVESLKAAAAFVVGWGEGGFYGNQLVYADSFAALLQGRLKCRGRLPVRVSAEFPLGSGLAPAP